MGIYAAIKKGNLTTTINTDGFPNAKEDTPWVMNIGLSRAKLQYIILSFIIFAPLLINEYILLIDFFTIIMIYLLNLWKQILLV